MPFMGQHDWLQHPTPTETNRFHHDTKGWAQQPMVFVDIRATSPGEPALLKSRSYVRKAEASALWRRCSSRAGVSPPQW